MCGTKHFNRHIPLFLVMLWSLTTILVSQPIAATTRLPNCYDALGLPEPALQQANILYIFVDQTISLTPAMKSKVTALVSDWGSADDRIKIARFSANIHGQYTELMFDESADPAATDEYLFHLRIKDKRRLLACLQDRRESFHVFFNKALTDTLNLTNPKLPKTDLFYSLQELANKTMTVGKGVHQTVLIISDGLENSDFLSFHGRGIVKKIDPQVSMEKLARHALLADWNNSDIYMYGLGYVNKKTSYIRPKLMAPLKAFWRFYFVASHGNLIQLGSPDLLLTSIRKKP